MKFKKGYYYKFIGKDKYPGVEDGNWHKCIANNTNRKLGQFENIDYLYAGKFPASYFLKSKYSPKDKIIKLLKKT
jgi:hypothetical protein